MTNFSTSTPGSGFGSHGEGYVRLSAFGRRADIEEAVENIQKISRYDYEGKDRKKNTYREFVGVDASMADLMRPGMYGAYHHITVLGKESASQNHIYDVTGSLCENNDKFAIQRSLPEVDIGDILVVHDTGAHGHATGFNYNGKLRSAELLLREDGTAKEIRRVETVEDYFATLDFSAL